MRKIISGQDDLMFSPKTKNMLFVLPLCAVAFLAADLEAQSGSAQYQARLAALQQAQTRSQTVIQTVEAAPTRVAQGSATRVPRRMIPAQAVSTPVRGYQPAHTRSAQLLTEGTIIDGGAPILSESVITGPAPVVGQPIISETIQGPIVQGPVIHQGPVDGGVIYGGEVVTSGCDTCGDSGSYFIDDCCGRGGSPEVPIPYWQGCLGRALRTGSYFFGATAFRHPAFTSPVGTDLVEDSNFGAHFGFNLGVPLPRVLGGRLSGQFGVRSVQSNFSGNAFTDSGRDQVFITAGVYRRVDYGLQAGLVVDFLAEEYFAESDIAQLRGEVSWAYPNGGAIGFRFTSSQESDSSIGSFNGTPFNGFETTTEDHYRFFLRKVVPSGGWEEIFVGWTAEDQFAIGADFDIPLQRFVALEAGAVLYLSELQDLDSNLGNTRIDDSFNLYAGFAFRPQGVRYYRSYDRPLLPVADNGTVIIRR